MEVCQIMHETVQFPSELTSLEATNASSVFVSELMARKVDGCSITDVLSSWNPAGFYVVRKLIKD